MAHPEDYPQYLPDHPDDHHESLIIFLISLMTTVPIAHLDHSDDAPDHPCDHPDHPCDHPNSSEDHEDHPYDHP